MDWVFAYGSLLPAGHAVLPEGAVAADLHGWRRSWSVAMDNSVDLPDYKHYVAPDGHRPDLMVCYLDIDERPDAVVNGIAFRSARTSFQRWTSASATTSAATSPGSST